jgi:hypothetical protein
MGRTVWAALCLILLPGAAAAQGSSLRDVFVGYQQTPGESRPMHGASVGVVLHGMSRTARLLTVSAFSDPRETTAIDAFKRVGLSGSFEIYRPVFSLQAEATHYRGSISATVRFREP